MQRRNYSRFSLRIIDIKSCLKSIKMISSFRLQLRDRTWVEGAQCKIRCWVKTSGCSNFYSHPPICPSLLVLFLTYQAVSLVLLSLSLAFKKVWLEGKWAVIPNIFILSRGHCRKELGVADEQKSFSCFFFKKKHTYIWCLIWGCFGQKGLGLMLVNQTQSHYCFNWWIRFYADFKWPL